MLLSVRCISLTISSSVIYFFQKEIAVIRKENNYFIICTKSSSYIMRILEIGVVDHVYYGKRIGNIQGLEHISESFDINIGTVPYFDEAHQRYFHDRILYEYSTEGAGDSREASLSVTYLNGLKTLSFLFSDYRIFRGKDNSFIAHALSDENTETLELILKDESLDIYIHLFYTVYEEEDVILRSAVIENQEGFELTLNRASSLSIDFPYDDFSLLSYDGAWARERNENERKLLPGIVKIDSKLGTSSNEHSPLVFLKRQNSVYGFNLIYSGNHAEIIDVSPFGKTRIVTGINDFAFSWVLRKGERFATPEAAVTFGEDKESVSINFQNFVSKFISRGSWKEKERPILINSWEASYFNFTEESLLKLAATASELGFELFVLDDGWFGSRRDDTKGLGDWIVNKDLFPNGLGEFAGKINDMGLSFGLWVEPEMVNEDSDLYRDHPDWVIRIPGRRAGICRHQLVLDISRKDVRDYIFNALERVFSSANIEYVKWDMNRTITDYYTENGDAVSSGELMHRYMLGLYDLYERITRRFPYILFEGCASGGNRYDLGQLCFLSQIWTSDNTDLFHRLKIQEGTLMGFPLSTMAAHVSASPAHQSLRQSLIDSRFAVSSFGLLGYELDLNKLTASEKEAVRRQITFYKKYRHVFQRGIFRKLESLAEETVFWTVTYGKTTILMEYVIHNMPNTGRADRIRLPFLEEGKIYHIWEREVMIPPDFFGSLYQDYEISGKIPYDAVISGDILKNAGIALPPQFTGNGFFPASRTIGDNGARLYVIEEA